MNREIIAILRGIHPDEVIDVGRALIDEGIDRIEVPLNSAQPLLSIERLVQAFAGQAMIGAGTVLTPAHVQDVKATGATLIVSPDCNTDVIDATKAAGMHSIPGVATPTECFTALRHGADGLKLFPSFLIGPKGLTAIAAVLPDDARVYAVGGVGPDDLAEWVAAGASGFGIGTGVYSPGITASEVRSRARTMVAAYDAAVGYSTDHDT